MLKWNNQFATGSVLVDSQHRMLIDKLNELETLLGGPGPSRGACEELIHFLGIYASSHFRFEEQCMEHFHGPAQEQNKKAHLAFMDTYAKFKQQHGVQGAKPELLQNLHASASSWIQNHIVSVDIQLKSCVNN